MKKSAGKITLLSLVLCLLLAGPVQAIPVPDLQVRLGGLAYYDAVLDITWLADANLAATNQFGLTQSALVNPVAGQVGSTGSMTWATANLWIDGMNAASYLGFDDWRLPTLSPVSGLAAFNNAESTNGTTDSGFGATGVGWETGTGAIVSEMGWMYYGNLGNLGFCPPDSDPATCGPQNGWGLANTAPFSNVQPGDYWSGLEFGAIDVWRFGYGGGVQHASGKLDNLFAWAVRSGDVETAATVPEPSTMVLFGAALIGFVGAGRGALLSASKAVKHTFKS